MEFSLGTLQALKLLWMKFYTNTFTHFYDWWQSFFFVVISVLPSTICEIFFRFAFQFTAKHKHICGWDSYFLPFFSSFICNLILLYFCHFPHLFFLDFLWFFELLIFGDVGWWEICLWVIIGGWFGVALDLKPKNFQLHSYRTLIS